MRGGLSPRRELRRQFWLLIRSGMPLPFGPVPGNRLLSGICTIEYQYWAG